MLTKQSAIETMREYLSPGDTAHTILRHVSASGMTRDISAHVIGIHDGRPFITDVSYLAAKILGYRRSKKGGLRVGGCGMDMGYHVIYGLSRTLFPDGFGCTFSLSI